MIQRSLRNVRIPGEELCNQAASFPMMSGIVLYLDVLFDQCLHTRAPSFVLLRGTDWSLSQDLCAYRASPIGLASPMLPNSLATAPKRGSRPLQWSSSWPPAQCPRWATLPSGTESGAVGDRKEFTLRA